MQGGEAARRRLPFVGFEAARLGCAASFVAIREDYLVSLRLNSTSSRVGLVVGLAAALAALAVGGIRARTLVADARDLRPTSQPESGCDEETAARLAPVVQWHASQYPGMEVEDVYKLLHQSVAGPAHAIEDPDMARQWLDREWDSLGEPFENEEMFEPLSSDGRLVRVNLRPWRSAGRAPEAVLNAFIRTAETLPPDSARIQTELDAILACSDRIAGGVRLSASEVQSFFSDRERDGYPAIHHSDGYSHRYSPAYRVVFKSYLD